jgi:hypothetical protein
VSQHQGQKTKDGPGKQGDDQPLAPGFHILTRYGGQQIGPLCQQGGDSVAQGVGVMACVGVGKEQQLATGGLG